jgi:pyruvate,water dikinase|nr:PEP/pyruvate-binding domain-containing protein [Butyrivibrio sp.]
MSQYVLGFDKIRKEDVAIAGGKGANLGEMTAARIPVPGGVVISADAYELYMKHNNINVLDYYKADRSRSLEELRTSIRNGSFPDSLQEEIVEAYNSIGHPVAVRSSATAEDLEDASFAGQQETYLNVDGAMMLLQSIKDCYASLWGDRAVSYRMNSGYDSDSVKLAVVIQEMVNSDISGVMFTSDPSGDADNVHINASYGLGEAIVSGIVSPDEYITDRYGCIKCQHIGDKKDQIVYSLESHGTCRIHVPDNMRTRKVMSDEQVSRLVAEGLNIEKHYGHPMDIEWAFKDDKIYILQARAITTISKCSEKKFTDADFEGLPVTKPAKGKMRENILFNLEKTPTPYYPLDHDFGGFVGQQKEILFDQIGLKFGDGLYPIDDNGITSLPSNKIKITKGIFALPRYWKMICDIDNNIAKSEESLKACTQAFHKEKELRPVTVKELGLALERMHDLIGKTVYDRFLYALFPNAIESMKVTKVLKKIDKNLNSFDVLEGLSYITADINRELSLLAAYINSDPEMAAYVDSHSYEEIAVRYPELGTKLSTFMVNYGSKSDYNCYCFAAKTWREDKERFISVLRPMVKSGAGVATLEEGEKSFDKLMNKVKASVSASKYADFEKRVKAVRHYHYIREASQYLWESEFEYCRQLLDKLCKAMPAQRQDLLMLFADELYDVCKKGSLDDYKDIIERRKAKRPLAEAYFVRSMERALSTDSDDIVGIAGSTGQATGKVCIVTSPAEFNKLCKGDILVCTYTDPEWTPLFTLAAGVVVDTGGTLSHAAIVAREYNIPAVLATGDATSKLKDGDKVMVDGTSGKVVKI